MPTSRKETPPTSTIRAFIAIELDDPIRRELARVQTKLRAAGSDTKWVEPGNIHLTLKFLGDITAIKVGDILGVIEKTVSSLPPFSIDITELGAFPRPQSPRIIWAGINPCPDRLAEMVLRLERSLKGLGFPEENRPFSAHITLGRLRSQRGKERLIEALEATELPKELSQKIEKITLFQSQLTSLGPLYSILGEVRWV